MRILVCGGRDFTDTDRAYRLLDKLHRERGVDVIIEGNARGADRIAGFWARKNNIPNMKFAADWKKHGKRAGPIRNAEMLKNGQPDAIVAFPGGRGTADMISRGKAAGVDVWEVT